MKIDVYPPELQGYGEFDNGNIREQKPIGFSGEGSKVNRSGTLFYWAWMQATGKGKIGMHPHSAFEILTYALSGTGRHVDTLGNDLLLEPGGAQVMQAGKGLFHEEHTLSDGIEGFQIWFEPNLLETQQKKPSYHSYTADDFKNSSSDPGLSLIRIAGPDSPIDYLDADASVIDLRFKNSTSYSGKLESGRLLNILAVRSNAELTSSNESVTFNEKDFVVVFAEEDGEYTLQAETGTHLLIIETPRNPGYRLYPKSA